MPYTRWPADAIDYFNTLAQLADGQLGGAPVDADINRWLGVAGEALTERPDLETISATAQGQRAIAASCLARTVVFLGYAATAPLGALDMHAVLYCARELARVEAWRRALALADAALAVPACNVAGDGRC
jgi:hypothetical protein